MLGVSCVSVGVTPAGCITLVGCGMQEAQGALHESRALRSQVALAEQAQQASRAVERDYEEVVRALEGELVAARASYDHSLVGERRAGRGGAGRREGRAGVGWGGVGWGGAGRGGAGRGGAWRAGLV